MSKAGFSVPVSIAFCINYVVGAGSLTIPWAFQQAGSLLGISMMLIMSYFSISAVLFLLEAMARAEAISTSVHNEDTLTTEYLASLSYQKLEQQIQSTPLHSKSRLKLQEQLEITPQITPQSSPRVLLRHKSFSITGNTTNFISYNSFQDTDKHIKYSPLEIHHDDDTSNHNHHHEEKDNNHNNDKDEPCIIKIRKFEISELCEIFLGENGKRMYTAIISVYMYGTLWVFGTVFANAMSSHFNFGKFSYQSFLLLFAFIVIPISCMELSEQVYVQVTLSFCRIMMILTMLCTILYSDFTSSQPFLEFPENLTHSSFFSMNVSNLYILLPIAAYANIFHHSIPALAQPVQNKKQLLYIFGYTILFCFIAYSLIGTIISTFFGNLIKTSSNLNWISYSGFSRALVINNHDSTSNNDIGMINIPWYAKLISTYVVCFPGLDVSSAFPLCTITLGNNLMSAYYGRQIQQFESNRSIRIFFRLLAALPPLFLASWISNLGQVTNFTGITGFAVAFIFPALLGLCSKKLMFEKMQSDNKNNLINNSTTTSSTTRNHHHHHHTSETYFSHYILTSDWNMYLTLALGIFLVVFVITSLIIVGPPM